VRAIIDPALFFFSFLVARGAGRETNDYRCLSLSSMRRDVDDGRIGRRLFDNNNNGRRFLIEVSDD
jgi:hypothetical protein